MTELDANLTLGSPENGLNLFMSIGAEIAQTTKKLNDTNERLWNKLQFGTPTLKREAKAVVYPATGYATISLGKPEIGYYWDVESITVGGTDFNVTAAGTAGIYVFGTSNGSSPGLTNGVEYFATLPNTEQYGYRDISLNASDHLIVCIFGGTPGQTYVANVVASVYNVAAALGDNSNIS